MHAFTSLMIFAVAVSSAAIPSMNARQSCNFNACAADLGPGVVSCLASVEVPAPSVLAACAADALGALVGFPANCVGCFDGPHQCTSTDAQCPGTGVDYNGCLDFCANSGQDLSGCANFCQGTCGC